MNGNMSVAPIVLNVYKRPVHTKETLTALKKCDLSSESILYIYCDGPKEYALNDDIKNIRKVREIIRSEEWCKEVRIYEYERNMGLVKSFVTAISEVINKHGKVIVLEDDQVVSKGFLRYMNQALDIYESEERVMHISGYMYPAKFKSNDTTIFLNVQSCPGWGTWKRAWKYYNHDVSDHLSYFRGKNRIIKYFDIGGNSRWFSQLEKNENDPGYSFAVRWYASCFRKNGLSLFPAKSLVKNIGLDGTGEHCKKNDIYGVETVEFLDIKKIKIEENLSVRKSIGEFYKKHYKSKNSVKIKKLLNNIISYRRNVGSLLEYVYPELKAIRSNSPGYEKIIRIIKNAAISENVKIYGTCRIQQSEIGAYTYIGNNSHIYNSSIGKFCSIGSNFYCGEENHPVYGISTSPMFYSNKKHNGITISTNNKIQELSKILIGNDVKIGENVVVKSGVIINDGAVIESCTYVKEDVPSYAIVSGSPMKIIGYRFDESIIDKLKIIKWWDWEIKKLDEVEKMIFNVNEFTGKYL